MAEEPTWLSLKRLFDLPVVLQQPDVVGKPVAALGNGGQDVQNPAVQLAGVGLPADIIEPVKAEARRLIIRFISSIFALSPSKQRQEAGLGAGRAAAAEETDGRKDVAQLLQIQHQVLQPERRTLADGHQLRGLIVRIAEAGQGGIAVCEVAQIPHDAASNCPSR